VRVSDNPWWLGDLSAVEQIMAMNLATLRLCAKQLEDNNVTSAPMEQAAE